MVAGSVSGGIINTKIGYCSPLANRLEGVKGVDASAIMSGGATSLVQSLPDCVRNAVLVKYNVAPQQVLRVGLIPTCLSVAGAAALEWRSVKKKPAEEPSAETGGKEKTTEKAYNGNNLRL